ncbi:MAG: hypothetical protein AAGJ18_13315, partial [Bacteroidota bacterium]
GGASGSPIIDSLGYLVGILSGMSVSPVDGSDALLGVSTHYLKKVLDGEANRNQPLTSIYDFFNTELEKNDFETAIQSFKNLKQTSDVYFKYSISPEELNEVATEQLDKGNADDAIRILQLSLAENAYFSTTHAFLGKAYLAKKESDLAKKAIDRALELWPEDEVALELLKTAALQKQ